MMGEIFKQVQALNYNIKKLDVNDGQSTKISCCLHQSLLITCTGLATKRV